MNSQAGEQPEKNSLIRDLSCLCSVIEFRVWQQFRCNANFIYLFIWCCGTHESTPQSAWYILSRCSRCSGSGWQSNFSFVYMFINSCCCRGGTIFLNLEQSGIIIKKKIPNRLEEKRFVVWLRQSSSDRIRLSHVMQYKFLMAPRGVCWFVWFLLFFFSIQENPWDQSALINLRTNELSEEETATNLWCQIKWSV